jgi:ribonucleoside-diphosphate reductase alpha chain
MGRLCFRSMESRFRRRGARSRADILAQKYFRKAGVAAHLKKVEENDVPSWLWRSVADEKRPLKALPKEERFGRRATSTQVFDRLAGTWTYWGWKGKYFDTEADAQAFFDEHALHARQRRWPRRTRRSGSTPACTGPTASMGRGRATIMSISTGELTKSKSAYEHPQPHACFIQSVEDDLVNENGIMDLWVREARLFKYGSGTGSNFSKLRGENEKLSGGGRRPA